MEKIKGNTNCFLKIEDVTTSAIGEKVKNWVDFLTLKDGFLDLMNNGKDFATYNKAMEDSTHIYICDYVSIVKDGKKVKATKLKATIDGEDYDVTYIDDPMGLHYHLEIFLKKVGD